MIKENIISAITGIINSVENENLIEVDNMEIGYGYKVVFDAIVGEKELELAKELGDEAFDEFDIKIMTEALDRTDAQLDTILKEVRAFAKTKPEVGKWIKGGKITRCTDYDLDRPFRYEVIEDGVIKVA